MRSLLLTACALAALTGCLSASRVETAASAACVADGRADSSLRAELPPLTGAWRLVETAVRVPARPWEVRPAPQGGMFVFSARHYSYFYVRGELPRPHFADANRPTDAERAATYDTFIAGAGRYEVMGCTVTLMADYRKNPNEMTGAPWRWSAASSGDTLRFVFANPPFLPGRDWRLTLVRVE